MVLKVSGTTLTQPKARAAERRKIKFSLIGASLILLFLLWLSLS